MSCVLQYGVLDIQAMTMAFAAVAVAPIQHVTRHRPPARITTVPNLVMVALGATFVCLSQVLVSALLHSCSWFHGGNGGTYQVEQFPALYADMHKRCLPCKHSSIMQPASVRLVLPGVNSLAVLSLDRQTI